MCLKMLRILERNTTKQLIAHLGSLSLWLDRQSGQLIDSLGEGCFSALCSPCCAEPTPTSPRAERKGRRKRELPVAWRHDSYRGATAGNRGSEKRSVLVLQGGM